MTSLHNINTDGAYDGQQRRLEDFQFVLENVLTMSQLVAKSAEERYAALVMLDILAGTKSRGCGSGRLRSAENQWTKVAARSACSKHCRTSQSDRA